MSENYRVLVQEKIHEEKNFVKATFTGGVKLWKKVIIRPVMIKGKRHIQFSYFDTKKDITKNYSGEEITKKLGQIFLQHFKTITVQTTDKTFQIEIPEKGKKIIHEHTDQKKSVPSFHDREKSLILSPHQQIPFLETIGIMTQDGKIKADRYSKFRQINEFLKIISQTMVSGIKDSDTLDIIDFGCGNGYLTFAVYYYFNEFLKKPVQVTGIDIQEDLLKNLRQKAASLEWQNMHFQKNTIKDFVGEKNAAIVIALHACDTATDDALAQAINMHSAYIFSSPCCHHNMQQQLDTGITPGIFRPVFRYPILGERLGDILTDTFRGLILQIMGYKTDIMEFISQEHTSKNLLIRAIKTNDMQTKKYIHEYTILKKYWKVTPY